MLKGLDGQDLTIEEEAVFLYIAEQFYEEEGANALYFQFKSIDANAQVAIDNYILKLVEGLAPVESQFMPYTTLTVGEMSQVYQIINHTSGGVSERKL